MDDVHVHVHMLSDEAREQIRQLETRVENLEVQGVLFMTKQEEMDATLDEINVATNEIAADIDDLQQQLLDAGVSQASIDRLKAASARLKGIAADHTVPVPPEPPQV